MRAAIETLRALAGRHPTILVAGDMLELGSQAEELHREIGACVCRAGIERLFATGQYAQALADGADQAGGGNVSIFIGTREAILEAICPILTPDAWILVKGSRSMGMETLVAGLVEFGGGNAIVP